MSGKRILIVDDSTSIREVVKLVLEEYDFLWGEAENGKEALGELARQDYDIILCDVNMPVMDGLAMLEKLTTEKKYKKHSDIPVIMLTTEAGQDQKDLGMTMGVTNWLVKPFRPDTLIEAVERVSMADKKTKSDKGAEILFQNERITLSSRTKSKNECYITLQGQISIYITEILKNKILDLFEKFTTITADCSDIEEIDSAGFQLIKSLDLTNTVSEKKFLIAKSSSELNRIFTLFHEKNLEL